MWALSSCAKWRGLGEGEEEVSQPLPLGDVHGRLLSLRDPLAIASDKGQALCITQIPSGKLSKRNGHRDFIEPRRTWIDLAQVLGRKRVRLSLLARLGAGQGETFPFGARRYRPRCICLGDAQVPSPTTAVWMMIIRRRAPEGTFKLWEDMLYRHASQPCCFFDVTL